jgi:hypothetical protein
MDGAAVSRIDRWTRQLLEVEAKKRGIRDPEARSQTELLWAIGKHDYGARQSLRKLVGGFLGLSRRDKGGTKRLAEPAAPSLQPTAAEPAPEPSRLELRREGGQLELSWQISELDAQRARHLLGQHGELSLRIVCVQADPIQVVRSSITEHGPVDPHGEWSWVLPGPDSHCVGSVGVKHGDRFVSIAHESSRVPLG